MRVEYGWVQTFAAWFNKIQTLANIAYTQTKLLHVILFAIPNSNDFHFRTLL